jgi:hypothetical protein
MQKIIINNIDLLAEKRESITLSLGGRKAALGIELALLATRFREGTLCADPSHSLLLGSGGLLGGGLAATGDLLGELS